MADIVQKAPSQSIGTSSDMTIGQATGQTTGNLRFAQKLQAVGSNVLANVTEGAGVALSTMGMTTLAAATQRMTNRFQASVSSAMNTQGIQQASISTINTQFASNSMGAPTNAPVANSMVGVTPAQQQMQKMASALTQGNAAPMGQAGFSASANMGGVSSSMSMGGIGSNLNIAAGAGANALPTGGMSGTGSAMGTGGTDMTASSAMSNTSGSSNALFDQTKQMQEMQMSFNLQYLQLQNTMQNENRQFTMVSNIMKTKHDTVKNTISNVR